MLPKQIFSFAFSFAVLNASILKTNIHGKIIGNSYVYIQKIAIK